MKKQILLVLVLAGRMAMAQEPDCRKALDYCVRQAAKTCVNDTDVRMLPRSIKQGATEWRYTDYKDWTSGFWPGILWNVYAYTGDTTWKKRADNFTRQLTNLAFSPAYDHDLGFQLFCSFGNGYQLTQDTFYKRILLAGADTLATLFNARVGTILSWPRMVQEMHWPHNTIMDNMMNLELLFWAAKNGGSKKLYHMAVSHAKVTMQHHFRPDYTSYHVAVYDTTTGKFIKGLTHQGLADSSMWARGQAWAIYGYTMVYRETHNKVFLDFAQKVADVYLARLPVDGIPFWDFSAAALPGAPKDASAAAITASALTELCTFVKDKNKAAGYQRAAANMLATLSSGLYQSREVNSAFLLHSTGHKPANSEVDASINYADYYYLEALLRYRKLNQQ